MNLVPLDVKLVTPPFSILPPTAPTTVQECTVLSSC